MTSVRCQRALVYSESGRVLDGFVVKLRSFGSTSQLGDRLFITNIKFVQNKYENGRKYTPSYISQVSHLDKGNAEIALSVTRPRTGRSMFRISVVATDCFYLQNVHAGFGSNAAFYSMGTAVEWSLQLTCI